MNSTLFRKSLQQNYKTQYNKTVISTTSQLGSFVEITKFAIKDASMQAHLSFLDKVANFARAPFQFVFISLTWKHNPFLRYIPTHVKVRIFCCHHDIIFIPTMGECLLEDCEQWVRFKTPFPPHRLSVHPPNETGLYQGNVVHRIVHKLQALMLILMCSAEEVLEAERGRPGVVS